MTMEGRIDRIGPILCSVIYCFGPQIVFFCESHCSLCFYSIHISILRKDHLPIVQQANVGRL